MSTTSRLGIHPRHLIPASLLYLALPYAIFFAGWLKWCLALACTGLLALTTIVCVREARRNGGDDPRRQAPGNPAGRTSPPAARELVLPVLVALLLLGISGVGGHGYQEGDWRKHNSVLRDLVEQPWPVIYRLDGQDVPLVYYVAYYLPAALVGKAGGWLLANRALFAWSLAGLVLALKWFIALGRRAAPAAVLLFVTFSGMDVVGQVIATLVVVPVRPEVAPILRWDHLEQWAIAWQYSSNATLLFWVPHQALAGWIAAGLSLYAVLHSRERYGLFTCSLAALWSPFVALGLLPYLAAGFLSDEGTVPERLRRYASLPNLCGLALLGVMGLYYGARLVPASPLLPDNVPHGFVLSFAPDGATAALGAAVYVVFCLLEFGLYAALVRGPAQSWSARARAVFLAIVAFMALLPLYRYGDLNELVMRASIPALFGLAVFVARALDRQATRRSARLLLAALLVLGAATPLVEIGRQVAGIVDAGALLRTPPESRVTSLGDWDVSTEKGATVLRQYVGSSRTPFFEQLAREEPRPAGAP